MDLWGSTPRIAFLSPEPDSGKTRALEVTALLVPRPVHAFSASPAYLIRRVSDEEGPPTILYDEIDTVFGPRARGNDDIRAMLNAGHRKGATAGRCVTRDGVITTEELPAYCAVALAGLGNLPDTIRSRTVALRMRRRAPSEHVDDFRDRLHEAKGHLLRDRLAEWTSTFAVPPWPTMPDQITNRDADKWEPLLFVAERAGGRWPERARAAAVTFVTDVTDAQTLGVLLLTDLWVIFEKTASERIFTTTLLKRLNSMPESPWGDLHGKPLDARTLSRMLRNYGVSSPGTIRIGAQTARGYHRADLHDPWTRYVAGYASRS
jgi:hypothetical protein